MGNVISLDHAINKRLHKSRCLLSNDGFIDNCDIELIDGDNYFGYNQQGYTIVTLNGYKILPQSVYEERVKLKMSGNRKFIFLLLASGIFGVVATIAAYCFSAMIYGSL